MEAAWRTAWHAWLELQTRENLRYDSFDYDDVSSFLQSRLHLSVALQSRVDSLT